MGPIEKPRQQRLSLRRNPKRTSKVTCRRGLFGIGPNIAVRLLDISETGIRLMVNTQLEVRKEVEIGLLAPGCLRETMCKGEIVWSVPAQDGNHIIGIRLYKRLEYATVSDLSALSQC